MAVKALFDKMCEKSEGIDNSEFVYIEHADCEADALTLKQKSRSISDIKTSS